MKVKFAIALLAISMLCASAVAQEETADSWMKKGYELMGNRSYEEAIKAMQKAVELDPENATLWDAKAQSLAFAVSFPAISVSTTNPSMLKIKPSSWIPIIQHYWFIRAFSSPI